MDRKVTMRIDKEDVIINILYVAPDISVPHTGDFVGGSTHVMKIAESLVKRGNNIFIISRRVSSGQKKYEEISGNIFTRRVYRGLILPIHGKLSSKEEGEEKGKFWDRYGVIERTYFLFYRFVLVFLMLYLLKKYKIDVVLDRSSSKGIGVFSGFLLRIPTLIELLDPDYSNLSLRLANKIFVYSKRIVKRQWVDVNKAKAGLGWTPMINIYDGLNRIYKMV